MGEVHLIAGMAVNMVQTWKKGNPIVALCENVPYWVMFAGVDMSDKDALNKAFAKYKELMKPVYTAYGMNDNRGGLTRVLNQDVESFTNQISNILSASNYRAVDSMV